MLLVKWIDKAGAMMTVVDDYASMKNNSFLIHKFQPTLN